jgi:hypothetical protein
MSLIAQKESTMGTFSRSWDLISESFQVIRKDKKLIVFPILSGFSVLAVAALYFIPLFQLGIVRQYTAQHHVDPAAYAWMFLWYCTNYFVIFFFSCALAACAQIRFSGGEPTLGAGMSQASAKLLDILLWALVASTVGLIIRIIEDRSESVGKIFSSLVGAAWAIVTYLMVPVIVFEQENVFGAIKRSSQLLRKTGANSFLATSDSVCLFSRFLFLESCWCLPRALSRSCSVSHCSTSSCWARL